MIWLIVYFALGVLLYIYLEIYCRKVDGVGPLTEWVKWIIDGGWSSRTAYTLYAITVVSVVIFWAVILAISLYEGLKN